MADRISNAGVALFDEHPLLDALVQVSFKLTAILRQVAAANGLSLTQLRLLAILRDREPAMSELAEHLGLDRSSVSGLIDRAAQRDLVQRIPSDLDRRSTRVTLTARGRSFAAELTKDIAARTDHLTGELSPQEQEGLARLLLCVLHSRPTDLPAAT